MTRAAGPALTMAPSPAPVPTASPAGGPSASTAGPASVTQIVTFRLDRDLFAADVRAVERVLRYQVPTAVPNVPAWVCGVIEYQKRVVPVIDLRARFELPCQAPTATTRLLVFNAQGHWIGAVVDAVLEVSALERARLEPPPPLFRGLSTDYLRGIIRRDTQLVILLDVDRFLTATERVVLQQASDAAAATKAPPSAAHG